MKKLIVVICVLAFAVGFTMTALAPTAEAARPCIGTCIFNTWLICCPDGQGGWDCYWGGPCDWGPIF